MTEKKAKKNILQEFELRQMKKINSSLRTGDTVKVHVKIKEGDKERVQIFEGVVTRFPQGNHRSTITVRKISFGVGVERIFPLHAPIIDRIERIAQGHVRRSRLYYLRKRKGKAARIDSDLTTEETSVIESLGTVATGPAIPATEEEKKSAAVEALKAE